jgi:hypothetical protein
VWELERVDFQPLKDKMVGKLVIWDGKNINVAGPGALVKFIITFLMRYVCMCIGSLAPKACNLYDSYIYTRQSALLELRNLL